MCQRTCPNCHSQEHTVQYGLGGTAMYCDGCGVTLAFRADVEWAPISTTDDEADRWAAERTFILAGAEAKDPKDDKVWRLP